MRSAAVGAQVALALLLGLAVLGCGDDKKKKTRFDASIDAGSDAGSDAGVLYEVPDYPDAEIPRPTPTCSDRECERIAGACRQGWCNGDSGECEFESADDGTTCGDPTNDDCTQPDLCFEGLCEPNDYPADSPCGVARVCHERDTCDGMGTCVDKGFTPAGSGCGDASESECDGPDSCDGMGRCDDNNVALGEACNPEKDVDCGGEAYPDTCNGDGLCIGNGLFPPGNCPRGSSGQGACLCGDTGIAPGHPCPDVCDPAGLCMRVGNACL